MPFYAVYETATGRLVSVGDVLPPEGVRGDYTALELPSRPDLGNIMWDASLKNFVPRPATVLKDRWEDLQTLARYEDFRNVVANLPQAQRDVVRNAIIMLLGGQRFRNPTSDTELP